MSFIAVGSFVGSALVGTAGVGGAVGTTGLLGAGGSFGLGAGSIATGLFGTAAASSTAPMIGGIADLAATATTTSGLIGAGGFGATMGSLGSMAMANPLMLGQAALGLAGGLGSTGTAFQDKISLSAEGKQLEGDYLDTAKNNMDKAKKGNVTDNAFQDISNSKTAESMRARGAEQQIGTAQAMIGNESKDSRGMGVSGGQFVKGQLANAGEQMTGLFNKTSILNNYRKEDLMNATKSIQNVNNLDNQVASFNYASALSSWGANQQLASDKGAAIGNAIGMIGDASMNQAYKKQMQIA